MSQNIESFDTTEFAKQMVKSNFPTILELVKETNETQTKINQLLKKACIESNNADEKFTISHANKIQVEAKVKLELTDSESNEIYIALKNANQELEKDVQLWFEAESKAIGITKIYDVLEHLNLEINQLKNKIEEICIDSINAFKELENIKIKKIVAKNQIILSETDIYKAKFKAKFLEMFYNITLKKYTDELKNLGYVHEILNNELEDMAKTNDQHKIIVNDAINNLETNYKYVEIIKNKEIKAKTHLVKTEAIVENTKSQLDKLVIIYRIVLKAANNFEIDTITNLWLETKIKVKNIKKVDKTCKFLHY